MVTIDYNEKPNRKIYECVCDGVVFAEIYQSYKQWVVHWLDGDIIDYFETLDEAKDNVQYNMEEFK